MISSSGSGKNIEVSAELRTNTGLVLERVISHGSGEPKVTQYNSMVYRNNQTPSTSLSLSFSFCEPYIMWKDLYINALMLAFRSLG
jgi:hypothetical protein